MGCDTKGKVLRKVTLEELVTVIENLENVSREVEFDINNRDYGFIYFNYKGEDRGLYYSTSEDELYLSLGLWGCSIEIITLILENFGGFIDDNDCDSEDYYEVECKGKIAVDVKTTAIIKLIHILDCDFNTAQEIYTNKEEIMEVLR